MKSKIKLVAFILSMGVLTVSQANENNLTEHQEEDKELTESELVLMSTPLEQENIEPCYRWPHPCD